jgi:cytochrome b6-f complex iron-sulfur subunit
MDRRKFLESVCAAGASIAVASTFVDIPIFSAAARSSRTSADVRELPINLTDAPELKPVGGTYHLEIEDTGQDILVVHAAKDKFIAVDLKCTHGRCDIDYESDSKKFVCPCHGAEFDLYGHVLKGPAQKPLNYYHAELRGDEVIVTVYGPGDPVPPNSIPPPLDSTLRGMTVDSTSVKAFSPDSIHRPSLDSTGK